MKDGLTVIDRHDRAHISHPRVNYQLMIAPARQGHNTALEVLEVWSIDCMCDCIVAAASRHNHAISGESGVHGRQPFDRSNYSRQPVSYTHLTLPTKRIV